MAGILRVAVNGRKTPRRYHKDKAFSPPQRKRVRRRLRWLAPQPGAYGHFAGGFRAARRLERQAHEIDVASQWHVFPVMVPLLGKVPSAKRLSNYYCSVRL